jgi:hypothetical protein
MVYKEISQERRPGEKISGGEPEIVRIFLEAFDIRTGFPERHSRLPGFFYVRK